MTQFVSSFIEAIKLIISFNKEVYFITFTSLKISILSTIIASMISIPTAIIISLKKFKLKKIIIAFLNSLMAIPTVVIGLFVYSLISRSGIFGSFNLLFTPFGIVIGQTLLSIPIITLLIILGISKIDKKLYETLVTYGANKFQIFYAIVRESRFIIISAILSGFGRVIGEVGVAMMLGGNIKGYTRTLTTAIALETSKGAFIQGFALGIILIIVALIVNFLVHSFNYEKR